MLQEVAEFETHTCQQSNKTAIFGSISYKPYFFNLQILTRCQDTKEPKQF